MVEETSLSDKIKEEEGSNANVLYVAHVKEFIKNQITNLVRLYAEEKTIHKNHRVQAMLIDLKTKLEEDAGPKLI